MVCWAPAAADSFADYNGDASKKEEDGVHFPRIGSAAAPSALSTKQQPCTRVLPWTREPTARAASVVPSTRIPEKEGEEDEENRHGWVVIGEAAAADVVIVPTRMNADGCCRGLTFAFGIRPTMTIPCPSFQYCSPHFYLFISPSSRG